MKPKILIADDHQLFGNGLKELLQKGNIYEVYGPLKFEEEIKNALLELRPEILLLDINLGSTNGIELGKILKLDFPEIGIIMLTMYENESFLSKSKVAKVDGYLLKDCETHELFDGIQKVLNGGTCFIDIQKDINNSDSFQDSFLDKYNITSRELEIIDYLKKGLSNEDIAKLLTLSFHTIKTHRKNIYLKLKVSNVAELITLWDSNM